MNVFVVDFWLFWKLNLNVRCAMFIPLPPEGSVATSLLTGRPAPSPLFNMGPSEGFSCHVRPSRLMAAHKEKRIENGERSVRDGRVVAKRTLARFA